MQLWFKEKNTRKKQMPPQNGSNVTIDKLFRLALDGLNEAVIVIDQMNVIRLINRAMADLIGFTIEDLLGVDLDYVLKLENEKGQGVEAASKLQTISRQEPQVIRNYRLVDRQERRRQIEIKWQKVDELGYRLLLIRDISAELAEEEARSDFIATASHEMRTPVAAIEGYLALALNPQTATIDDRARQYLNQAQKSSEHLGRLFQDLLDTAKLDDARMNAKLEPLEISNLVAETTESLIPMAKNKGLELFYQKENTETSGGISLMPRLLTLADRDFVREILNNLIENAIKYTVHGFIKVSLSGDASRILIRVADSGIGMEPGELKLIFQKFYRVDSSDTRTIGGTGLGLYLVKKRVEAMGGQVWAESLVGKGSVFFVSLPRISETEYERQKLILSNQQKWQNLTNLDINQSPENRAAEQKPTNRVVGQDSSSGAAGQNLGNQLNL